MEGWNEKFLVLTGQTRGVFNETGGWDRFNQLRRAFALFCSKVSSVTAPSLPVHPISVSQSSWKLLRSDRIMTFTAVTTDNILAWWWNGKSDQEPVSKPYEITDLQHKTASYWYLKSDRSVTVEALARTSLLTLSPDRPDPTCRAVVWFIDPPRTHCCTSIGLNRFSFFLYWQGGDLWRLFTRPQLRGIRGCFTSCGKIKLSGTSKATQSQSEGSGEIKVRLFKGSQLLGGRIIRQQYKHPRFEGQAQTTPREARDLYTGGGRQRDAGGKHQDGRQTGTNRIRSNQQQNSLQVISRKMPVRCCQCCKLNICLKVLLEVPLNTITPPKQRKTEPSLAPYCMCWNMYTRAIVETDEDTTPVWVVTEQKSPQTDSWWPQVDWLPQ